MMSAFHFSKFEDIKSLQEVSIMTDLLKSVPQRLEIFFNIFVCAFGSLGLGLVLKASLNVV
ncbi:hypothetical protein MASR2M54_23600 [Aliarcobacter cryaerophilus]